MTTIVQGIDGLRDLVGQHLGYSDYVEVTQEQVNLFADATGDHQWIHVDVERAKKESPFGGPIAHGYLTLSMGPRLVPQVVAVTGTQTNALPSLANIDPSRSVQVQFRFIF